MEQFTNKEKANMHFIYGAQNVFRREAVRLYGKFLYTAGCQILKHLSSCIGNCVKWDTFSLPFLMQVVQGRPESQSWNRKFWNISSKQTYELWDEYFCVIIDDVSGLERENCLHIIFTASKHWLQRFIQRILRTSPAGSYSRARCIEILRQLHYSWMIVPLYVKVQLTNKIEQVLRNVNPHAAYPHVHHRQLSITVWAKIIGNENY